MRKKGRVKYFIIIIFCFFIFSYGFIKININKPELVRDKSKFTIVLKLKPVYFEIDTEGYVFYVNNKIFYDMKEKCIGVFNEFFSK